MPADRPPTQRSRVIDASCGASDESRIWVGNGCPGCKFLDRKHAGTSAIARGKSAAVSTSFAEPPLKGLVKRVSAVPLFLVLAYRYVSQVQHLRLLAPP